MKKKRIFHGLSYMFTLLLCISISAGLILEYFSTAIDTALGTTSSKVVSNGDTYTLYTPDEAYLNEDGTGNAKALISAAIDLGRREEAEGAVLLKNENNVLPLESGANVTLLGGRSYYTLLGLYTGNTIRSPYISLYDALGSNKTDFNNPENCVSGSYSGLTDFEFDGAGYNLNPVMKEAYTTVNKTYGLTAIDAPIPTEFNPNEPTLSDLKATGLALEESVLQYNDAAIVTVGRPSRESIDYTSGEAGVADGLGATDPLGLTTAEREIIAYACDNFEKVIVLVNTSTPMEIGELQDNQQIDAIVWIGFPGCYGTLGIADVLSGKISPSGAIADIYVEKNTSAPAVQNLNLIKYENVNEIDRNDSKYYLIEAEGIYTGYRYYETRYYDSIANPQSKASSTMGAYASSGNWNYEEEVVYSFGYGLSYTSFSQEIVNVAVNKAENEFTLDFTVKVTNVGDNYAGKSIVQIYGQAPYEEGMVEKSAIQLLAYDKTETLKPGESETITINVDLQNIASYDEEHDNGNGTYGTYILDAGNYYFSLGNGAHDALNNILAVQEYTIADGMDYEGDASQVYIYSSITERDDTTFAVSKNGTVISNQLKDFADWNSYEDAERVVYLSRSDWEGTYPKTYSGLSASQSMMDELNGLYYIVADSDDTSDIIWGTITGDHEYKFYELAGITWEDERWEDILNQMTMEEAIIFHMFGGPCLPGIETINLVSTDSIENGGNGTDLTLAGTKDTEAPWTISGSDADSAWSGEVFASMTVLASSFNMNLSYEMGEFIANEALFTGLSILWGPGINLHRTAYNSRNADYMTEDPILAGYMTMEYTQGAASKGLVAAPKHFAFNDQEESRDGISTFKTEQACREVELRAYQIPTEAVKYDKLTGEDVSILGLMTSYGKLGTQECTSSYGLITGILRNEWGYKGYIVSDGGDDTDLITASAVAGITGHDLRGATVSAFTLDNKAFKGQANGTKIKVANYENDATLQNALKESAKNTLYTLANSNMMNRYAENAVRVNVMTSWRAAYYGAIGVTGAGALVFIVLFLVSKKKEKEV